MNKVIIDTDFLNHIVRTPNGETVMKKIIDYFDYKLLMHPFVYKREIKNIHSDTERFVKNYVKVLKYSDFIKSEEDDYMYNFDFVILFKEMNSREISFGNQNYRTYHKSNENLGEIHSVLLSRALNIPVLLSDDFNAKEIAAKRMNHQGYTLEVIKSFELICQIAKERKDILSLDECRAIIRNHKPEKIKDYEKIIKEIYRN